MEVADTNAQLYPREFICPHPCFPSTNPFDASRTFRPLALRQPDQEARQYQNQPCPPIPHPMELETIPRGQQSCRDNEAQHTDLYRVGVTTSIPRQYRALIRWRSGASTSAPSRSTLPFRVVLPPRPEACGGRGSPVIGSGFGGRLSHPRYRSPRMLPQFGLVSLIMTPCKPASARLSVAP